MKPSCSLEKQQQIGAWVKLCAQKTSRVIVSNYTYNCFFSGCQKTKTLLVFPDDLEQRGIITIDKSVDEVELLDVVQLFEKIN